MERGQIGRGSAFEDERRLASHQEPVGLASHVPRMAATCFVERLLDKLCETFRRLAKEFVGWY